MTTLTTWPLRRWLAALAGATVTALATGIPTDVVPNPLFDRMTPVVWWNLPILLATSVLGGLVIATYVRSPAPPSGLGAGAGGGLLSALAIGCPVCNKIVLVLIGTGGALGIWAPLQPVLALVSLALVAWALRTRLAAERACPIPARRTPAPSR
jgi:hypothetical protein